MSCICMSGCGLAAGTVSCICMSGCGLAAGTVYLAYVCLVVV